jgi:hypothetical protein
MVNDMKQKVEAGETELSDIAKAGQTEAVRREIEEKVRAQNLGPPTHTVGRSLSPNVMNPKAD